MKRCPSCDAEFEGDVQYCPSDGSVLRAVEAKAGDALVGRIFDKKYRIIEKLGGGGMGAVFKAEHILLKQVVALKVIHGFLLEDKEYLERFQREARTAFKIKHQNAITLHDFGVDEGLPYLAMEYVDGHTLKTVLEEEGPLSGEKTHSIISQIAGALAEAHSYGVVHRDVKPENIMISTRNDGTLWAQMLDFGIAKGLATDDDPNITKAGTIFGSPRYMAPEQATSQGLDARSDLYALGVMIYEMLSNKPLFETTTAIDLIYKHVNVAPIPLRDANPAVKVTSFQNYVVMKLLQKDPADRYQSVAEFLPDFETAFNPKPELTSMVPSRAQRAFTNLLIAALIITAGSLAGMLYTKETVPSTENEIALEARFRELEEQAALKQRELEEARRLAEETKREVEEASLQAQEFREEAERARQDSLVATKEVERVREQRLQEEQRVLELREEAKTAALDAEQTRLAAIKTAETARLHHQEAERLAEQAKKEADQLLQVRAEEEQKASEIRARVKELEAVAKKQEELAKQAAGEVAREESNVTKAAERAAELEQQAKNAEQELQKTKSEAEATIAKLKAEQERALKNTPPPAKAIPTKVDNTEALARAQREREQLLAVERQRARELEAKLKEQRLREASAAAQLAKKRELQAEEDARQAELEKERIEAELEMKRRRIMPRQGKRR